MASALSQKPETPEERAQREADMRRILFVPCTSKRQLHGWIKTFLGLDMPDCIVDPNSTSCPMDMIWEVYSKALANDDPDFCRVLYFSARAAFKTLSAAVLEVLSVLHLGRDVAHMAAIESQSMKSQQYVKKFFSNPILRDFVSGDNKEVTWVCRYDHTETGENITEKEFAALSPAEKSYYVENKRYIRIVICTKAGANSEHVPFFCVDGGTAISARTDTFQGMVYAENAFRLLGGDGPGVVRPSNPNALQFLSWDPTVKGYRYKQVTAAERSTKPCFCVTTMCGSWIVCTGEHRLLMADGSYRRVSDLKPDDVLQTVHRRQSAVVYSVEEVGDRDVYDFSVSETHNYVSNSFVSHNCVDEIDVVKDPMAYEESRMIADSMYGFMPITVLISTRKFAHGLVQDEIDKQFDEDGREVLKVRHWNLIDVTAACEPKRHRPEDPKKIIYVNEDDLRALNEEKFQVISVEEKAKYVKDEAFAGCAECRIYPACRGRLATKQKSKSKLLKPISGTINTFTGSGLSVPTVKAQLLCLKPSAEGMIYASFEKATHMLTAAEIAEKISGVKQDPNLSKAQLLSLMRQWKLQWYSGMDFGYTHNFAVVTGAVDGMRCFIVDVISQAELEPAQQIQACDALVKGLRPRIFADPENPQLVATFKRVGYRMAEWVKGTVVGGIDVVRMKLNPPFGGPQLFLLKGDRGCELLAKRMQTYHWKTDAAGRPSNVPSDENDDECDALRYLVGNVFNPLKGRVRAAGENSSPADSGPAGVYTGENMVNKILDELGIQMDGSTPVSGRSGNFKYNM